MAKEKLTCSRCRSTKIATKGDPYNCYICLDCGMKWQTPEQAALAKAHKKRKKRRSEDDD